MSEPDPTLEPEAIRRINKLPCPICSRQQPNYHAGMNEGCTHPVMERLRAFTEIAEALAKGERA